MDGMGYRGDEILHSLYGDYKENIIRIPDFFPRKWTLMRRFNEIFRSTVSHGIHVSSIIVWIFPEIMEVPNLEKYIIFEILCRTWGLNPPTRFGLTLPLKELPSIMGIPPFVENPHQIKAWRVNHQAQRFRFLNPELISVVPPIPKYAWVDNFVLFLRWDMIVSWRSGCVSPLALGLRRCCEEFVVVPGALFISPDDFEEDFSWCSTSIDW